MDYATTLVEVTAGTPQCREEQVRDLSSGGVLLGGGTAPFMHVHLTTDTGRLKDFYRIGISEYSCHIRLTNSAHEEKGKRKRTR